MKAKTKIFWIVAGTAVAGTGFWLWWRQKDAVPPSAIPIMQQARAVIGTASVTATPGTAPTAPSTDTVLASIIPGYIPQNSQSI